MRIGMIVSVVLILGSPLLFAQSRASKSSRWSNHRHAVLSDSSRPTKVSGEGMSTALGVKYWDIVQGEGNPAAKGHVVTVLFTAWFENGKVFDSSASLGKPSTFTLGAGQVIRGWEDGMEGMKVGGKRQLRIPPDLAYGAAGSPPIVPPNSTLVFDIELVGLD